MSKRSVRLLAFYLTGFLWLASIGVLVAREVLPLGPQSRSLLWEQLFLHVAPYEELWYGIYYQESLVGGLKLHYTVEEEANGAMAVVKTSVRCNPLAAEGTIEVDSAYALQHAAVEFRHGETLGVFDARRLADAIVWKCNFQNKEWNFRTPRKDETELITVKKMPDGSEKIKIPLQGQTIEMDLFFDPTGMIQRADLPGAISVRRLNAAAVKAVWKKYLPESTHDSH